MVIKAPLGTRLKEFYDRKQMSGETIRSHDIQEKLMRIRRRDSNRVPDVEGMLKEQLVLGLQDDILRREIKKTLKESENLTFAELMQDAISWSEEEEVQTSDSMQSSSRAKGAVNATDEPSSQLTMEMLHEAIKKIAMRQVKCVILHRVLWEVCIVLSQLGPANCCKRPRNSPPWMPGGGGRVHGEDRRQEVYLCPRR